MEFDTEKFREFEKAIRSRFAKKNVKAQEKLSKVISESLANYCVEYYQDEQKSGRADSVYFFVRKIQNDLFLQRPSKGPLASYPDGRDTVSRYIKKLRQGKGDNTWLIKIFYMFYQTRIGCDAKGKPYFELVEEALFGGSFEERFGFPVPGIQPLPKEPIQSKPSLENTKEPFKLSLADLGDETRSFYQKYVEELGGSEAFCDSFSIDELVNLHNGLKSCITSDLTSLNLDYNSKNAPSGSHILLCNFAVINAKAKIKLEDCRLFPTIYFSSARLLFEANDVKLTPSAELQGEYSKQSDFRRSVFQGEDSPNEWILSFESSKNYSGLDGTLLNENYETAFTALPLGEPEQPYVSVRTVVTEHDIEVKGLDGLFDTDGNKHRVLAELIKFQTAMKNNNKKRRLQLMFDSPGSSGAQGNG